MGLEQVKDSILAEARVQAEQEVAKAREEAKAVRARAEERAREVRDARAKEAEAAASALRRRELALAELEAKKLRLKAEKDLLAKVRSQALERLGRMPAKDGEAYLAALAKRATLQDARAYAREQDKAAVERLGLKWAGPVEAVGGLVLESGDGAVREDLRYEYLLEDAWRDALGDVAQALFGKKG